MREDLAERLARYRQVKNGPGRHILLDGSDQRMDRTGNSNERVNAWPVRCDYCTLPDLDFVPSPYRIAKGMASTADLALADMGNLFVKERVKRVLELVACGDCQFHRAVHAKTGDETDWWLAVPLHLVKTAEIDASIPRCPRCGEPKVAHPGSHFRPCDVPPVCAELFKSAQWSSSESIAEQAPLRKSKTASAAPQAPQHQWTRLRLDRDLWLSVRLWELFKKLKFKGLRRDVDCNQRFTPEDRPWVDEQFAAANKCLT